MDILGNLYVKHDNSYHKLGVVKLDEFGNCKEQWSKIDKKTYESVIEIDLEQILENERFELDKWMPKN